MNEFITYSSILTKEMILILLITTVFFSSSFIFGINIIIKEIFKYKKNKILNIFIFLFAIFISYNLSNDLILKTQEKIKSESILEKEKLISTLIEYKNVIFNDSLFNLNNIEKELIFNFGSKKIIFRIDEQLKNYKNLSEKNKLKIKKLYINLTKKEDITIGNYEKFIVDVNNVYTLEKKDNLKEKFLNLKINKGY